MPGKFIIPAILLLLPSRLQAQESSAPLDIFGYFQSVFDNSYERTSIMGGDFQSTHKNTFMLQQANIFFRKQFSPKVISFVNLEFTNTYASNLGWGSFRIQEGWVWYEPVDAFSVKAGLLVPVFNNLNEIKNRMPLLPYIIRPLVYEAVLEGLTGLEEIVPQSAFFQVQGTVAVNTVKLDYAVYVGNGDKSFTTSNMAASNYLIGGTDTTSFKLIGGRAGLRAGRVKAGLSYTSDRSNRTSIGLGAVPRVRAGGDLSLQAGPLSLESEFIRTNELLDEGQQHAWDYIARRDPRLGKKPGNLFAYGVATYDLIEEVYVYFGFEYLRYHGTAITRGYMIGGGYRPLEDVVIKLGYMHIDNDAPGISMFHSDRIQAGVSVVF